MRICPNAAAIVTKTKDKNLLSLGRPLIGRVLQQDTLSSTANPEMRSGKGWILSSPLLVTQYIAYTWAPLGWPCLPTRCSITASSCDLAFLIQEPSWGYFYRYKNWVYLGFCLCFPPATTSELSTLCWFLLIPKLAFLTSHCCSSSTWLSWLSLPSKKY